MVADTLSIPAVSIIIILIIGLLLTEALWGRKREVPSDLGGDGQKELKAILSYRVPTAQRGRRESQHLTTYQRAW